ncbi:MAG TPA: PadR family transcriptional regulator [Actinomycetota bacterium]
MAHQKDLPSTAYAILGLLTWGEMSGYDLGKLIEGSIAHFFFKPAKSQIYAELRRLVGRGFATERDVAQDSRPDKRLYAVTPDGRQALRRWLNGSEAGPEVFRSPLCLKVFLGAQMDRETLAAQVKEALRQAQESLAAFQDHEGEIAGRPEFFYPNFVLQRGIAHERATIGWASDVLKALEQEQMRGGA